MNKYEPAKRFLSKNEEQQVKIFEDKLEQDGAEVYCSAVSLDHYKIAEDGVIYCKGHRIILSSEEDYNELVKEINEKKWIN